MKEVSLAEAGVKILCDDSLGKLRPIVPNSMRLSVLHHSLNLSHPGIRGSVRLLTGVVVWKGIKKDVASWARECLQCSRSKVQRHTVAPFKQVSPPPKSRITHVYVDLTSSLPPSNGFSYLMVIVCKFSRYIQAVPMKGITTEECADSFVTDWVSTFGSPAHIYCDRGAQFTNRMWKDLASFLGAELHHSTVYHPQSQGFVERVNRTVKTSLKARGSPSEWHDNLPWTLLALRNSSMRRFRGPFLQ